MLSFIEHYEEIRHNFENKNRFSYPWSLHLFFSESKSTLSLIIIFPLSAFSLPAIHLSVILFPEPDAPKSL